MDNQAISEKAGLSRHQVGLWRRRWSDAWLSLTALVDREPLRLRQAIRECLTDAPRPGCPGRVSAAQVSLILSLACEKPELSQRPNTHGQRQ